MELQNLRPTLLSSCTEADSSGNDSITQQGTFSKFNIQRSTSVKQAFLLIFLTSVAAGLFVIFNSVISSPLSITIKADDTQAVIVRGRHILHLYLGAEYQKPKVCSGPYDACMTWGLLGPRLTIVRKDLNRYSVELRSVGTGIKLHLDLKGRHLYGGPISNHWPAETAHPVEDTAFITGSRPSLAVAERSWFTSDGEALFVNENCHLFYTQTPESLILSFENKPPYPWRDETVKFEWCITSDAKGAYGCKPQQGRDVPKEFIKYPVWSTWARYRGDISQDKVMAMAEEIISHGFQVGTIEIDEQWETCYGTYEWDLKKFPNPKEMIQKLKALGFWVMLWVHPFINAKCLFLDASEKYMVKDLFTGEISITQWWNGNGGLINFSDPAAQDWFVDRLETFKKNYGITGFKFDAGEATYIPGLMSGTRILPLPNMFTNDYVNTVARLGAMGEVRVGSGNVDTAMFLRLQDTDSLWEADLSGLQSVIPNILTLSALGYSAVIPDVVGGNLQRGHIDEQLFIRWLQLNTFLPVIQFSIPPWQFSNETFNHVKDLWDLHKNYSKQIVTELESSDPTGRRTISPVWWLAPEDETALSIDSEFLLGEDILVAPVVQKNAFSRDIYLPPGDWADGNNGTIYNGPITIKNYPAPIYVLPYFIKQEPMKADSFSKSFFSK